MKTTLLSICCLFFAVSYGQTLHNGIELPKQWPPRYAEPTQREEMPVPYLAQKPAVIPINTGRQLFVDNFLIAQTNLKSVYHKPHYFSKNPVLEPDKEWEKTKIGALYAAPFSDGVWYDEKDKKFKMWYLAGAGDIHNSANQSFYTCYATSEDGKLWHKNPLHLIPNTNVVDSTYRDAATVWLDKNEKDPAKRFKMFNVEKGNYKRWHLVLKYSADGINWGKGVAQSGDIGDRSSVFYNPFTQKWVLSLREATSVSSRSRYYVEHHDPEMLVTLSHSVRKGVTDKNVVFWFTPSPKELRHEKYPDVLPGIYNFDAMPYESIVLGFYTAWSGPENKVCEAEKIQKRNIVSLGYSRDGFHFSRPSYQPFLDVNESEGAWNWGNVQSVGGVPIIVGDSLYFYASGRRLSDVMWDSHTSTGLATLRRDGFASVQAREKAGYLLTEKVSFDGKFLFVNADVKRKGGSLQVEIQDENGNPIRGFTKKDCLPVKNIDRTKVQIVWKNNQTLESLIGKVVRFKFYLNEGDLYAFWVSPWQSGESRGYTAGGGPNLNPSGIDTP